MLAERGQRSRVKLFRVGNQVRLIERCAEVQFWGVCTLLGYLNFMLQKTFYTLFHYILEENV